MTAEAAILADFRTEPYIHQLREFEVSAELPARALLWQMRTGKSKLVIDTACWLAQCGKIDAVLVFAPNGVHENWVQRELMLHHWLTVTRTTFWWRTQLKEDEAFREGFLQTVRDRSRLGWFCFASDTMTREDVRKFVRKVVKDRRCLVIFDESHDFRTPGSKRTKMARALAKRCPYRRILTGTMADNSPLHAYSQYELLKPKALGYDRYDDFKGHFAEYQMETTRNGRKYPALVGYRNLDELRELIAPYTSSVLRTDCHDLPDLVPERLDIELTENQKRIYRELHSSYVVDLDNGKEAVSIGEMSSRLAKLQQVVSGFLIDEYKDVHDIPGGNPRLEAVRTQVRRAPGKVIIWCAFREDMDRVVRALTADGHEVLEYHGRTSADDKQRAREAFQPGAENDVKALVGHPKSGGAGLDLSSASIIIHYSHTFDAIVRGQSDERATAIGGGNVRLLDVMAPGVDEYIREHTVEKVSIADALTREGLREVLNRIRI